jgi:hypothetical protein
VTGQSTVAALAFDHTSPFVNVDFSDVLAIFYSHSYNVSFLYPSHIARLQQQITISSPQLN